MFLGDHRPVFDNHPADKQEHRNRKYPAENYSPEDQGVVELQKRQYGGVGQSVPEFLKAIASEQVVSQRFAYAIENQ